MHLSQGSLLREDSTFGLGLGVEKKLVQCNLSPPARSPWFRRSLKSWQQRLGTDHQTGVIYGVVNWIVCVPSLVSYAHIVFPQAVFRPYLPMVVKVYFLSSAVMQVVMTLLSDVEFSIGQIQDVGLIFLAGMVRNLVSWGKEAGLTPEELITTSIWQSAISPCFVGISLIVIGKMKLIQYVQMLPLPVVGGYLGYIGYFCLAAGLGIGSGREVNDPSTLLQLLDPELALKMSLLAVTALVMIFVHFKVKHFLAMPLTLLLLPIVFFVCADAAGLSLEDCRARGLVPYPRGSSGIGEIWQIVNYHEVQWGMLPRQIANLIGLIIIVTFGSSLDVAAIQAELPTRKLDYNKELTAIGWGNLCSSFVCGATGSYIFSQTIFSAKRSVKSRFNGFVVAIGEFLLFGLPVDILKVLPNAYVGGIMCLFGVDIMNDWLFQSRHLMSRSEYTLVWISFGVTMWLTGFQTFGVIEGMAVGTAVASVFFVYQFAKVQDKWQEVSSRSSVVRPPQERRHLNGMYNSILAISLNSYAFFGTSFTSAQSIEVAVQQKSARFVCLDLGRLSGMDCTFADQIRLLVLSLEREGARVFLSSLRSKTAERLLLAHGVVGPSVPERKVFVTLDQALQKCEEIILTEAGKLRKDQSDEEWPLDILLLDYVEGFVSDKASATAAAKAAAQRFERLELKENQVLFRSEDPANAIFVVAKGIVGASSALDFAKQLGNSGALLASPQPTHRPSGDDHGEELGFMEESTMEEHDQHGVGAILNDTAFYSRRKCGAEAVAQTDCVVYRLRRSTMDTLEREDPAAAVLLQKVLLRDLSQLMAQFLCPLQAVSGLS